MFGRPGVVFNMISVVKEEQIVEPAVVARRSVFVLKVSLQLAQGEANEPARQVNGQKKFRCARQQPAPERKNQAGFPRKLPRPAPAPAPVAVMREMAVAPKSLRNSQHQTLQARENRVQSPGPEKGPMNEIMRDGVGVPPKADGDERDRRELDQGQSVRKCQHDKPVVPMRMPQD